MRSPVASLVAALGFAVAVGAVLAPTACTVKQPQPSTYFDRTIFPILNASCVRTNTGAGCHVSDAKGNAFGNLDTSSFEAINKRRDLLADYGPYGQPAMLVKNVPPFTVDIQNFDGSKVSITTDIKHTGGPILDPTATGYLTLRHWMDNGATENNTGVPPPGVTKLPCATTVPPAEPGFDPNTDPTAADFGQFKDNVNPVIKKTCAASNCHGSPVNDLYLTCGDTPDQVRWNYFAAQEYLAQTPEQSELVRRPLAPTQGGAYHEGGIIWQTTSDSDYKAMLDWAKAHGPLQTGTLDPNFLFFVHDVQPMLVKKGCMMLQCHSAAMFHEYRLRGGSGGSFSLTASKHNYALSLLQLNIESDDVEASRIVRKNLYRPALFPGGRGIAHRGGPLFEDFGGTPASGAACDAAGFDASYDYDNNVDKVPAFCMIREWHRRERAARTLAPLSAIIYVQRDIPSGSDRPQDFDVYAPGSDLRMVQATLDATGNVVPGAETSLTAGCGLDPSTADIKRPAVSWDGAKVAFAARASASEPLAIYEMNGDGTGCQKHAEINAGQTTSNGLLVHNFDPVYSPPGPDGTESIVFSSTRGNDPTNPSFDYQGTQRTPADPTKPNADLFVWEPDPANAGKHRIRQLTFQLNVERYPNFMADGRIIMTVEKRAPNFYQLALRRENLDGGDYHPLFAQRGSIGFHEASQVAELSDKDFAAIFSEQNYPHQGGALGIFNRSLGIDFKSQDATDYPIDQGVIDPNAPSSPEPSFFLHSLKFIDAPDTGKPSSGTYMSPAVLPDDHILVSYGPGDPATFNGDYDVYQVDPIDGTKVKLFGAAGKADIQAVAVFGRASHGIFASTIDEPNGNTSVLPFDKLQHPDRPEAAIEVLDMGILGSLLFQNTPTGRAVEPDLDHFDVYEDMPPPLSVTSFGAGGSNVVKDDYGQVYVRRRLLGTVNLNDDKSASFLIPGGLPIVLHLPDTAESKKNGYPRYQREAMSFSPGEYSHQSFRTQFFDGLCAACHGAVSGRAIDAAVKPDLLTSASDVQARGQLPTDLDKAPGDRGPEEGPPPTP